MCRCAVAPGALRGGAARAARRWAFAGANVTVPHKEAALRLVDRVDDAARRIGAVNTVVVRERRLARRPQHRRFGFLENLREQCAGLAGRQPGRRWCSAPAARRAPSLVALLDAGAPRDPPRQPHAARAPRRWRARSGGPIAVRGWDDRARALDGAGAAGQHHHARHDRPAGARSRSRPPAAAGAAVNDIVYVPLETPLLRAARGARPSRGRRARHAAAPGAARLRGLVRRRAGGGPANCAPSWRSGLCGPAPHDRARPHRLDRHGQVHRRARCSPAPACRCSMPMPPCTRCTARAARAVRADRARPFPARCRTARWTAPGSARRRARRRRRRCERLERIVHPLVAAERTRASWRARAARGAPLVVLDIPLLFETGGDAALRRRGGGQRAARRAARARAARGRA